MVQRSGTSERLMKPESPSGVRRNPQFPGRSSNEILCYYNAAFEAIASVLMVPWAGPRSCALFRNKMKAWMAEKLVFRREEATGLCATEPKESPTRPQALGSFEMEGGKHQKDKSKVVCQVSGFRLTQGYQSSP